MQKRIIQVINHPLISGSALLIVGTFMANIFNFLFNISMIGTLSASDYGVLASLASLILILALAAESFVPSIVRFSGPFFAKKQYDILKGLFLKFTRISLLVGIVFFTAIIFGSPFISSFFHIDNSTVVILLAFAVLLNFTSVVNRAILQAELTFTYLSGALVVSSIIKFIAGVGLVFLGLGVVGAMLGFFFSYLFLYLSTFFPLRHILIQKTRNYNIGISELLRYGGSSSATIIGLTFLITTDILMVKHFFDPYQAGLYAVLSLIGRVIYFFCAPIGMVMFPLVVQKKTKGEKYNSIFLASIFLVLASSFGITLFYFLFPEFVIKLFARSNEYLVLKPYIGLFGIFISLYCLLTIITNFFLSIKKTHIVWPIIIISLAQAILIYLFHSTFFQIIYISLGSVIFLLTILLLYYLKLYGQRR